MEAILEVKKSKQRAVMEAIKQKKRKAPEIYQINSYSDQSKYYVIVAYHSESKLDDTKIKKELGTIDHVTKIKLNKPLGGLRKNVSNKNCHFVFDVDSTLTSGRGMIQNEIRNIFNELKEGGHRIYLASGRNMDKLREDMREFGTERYGIAENGGISVQRAIQ